MGVSEKEDKIERLCSGFLMLDDRDQQYMLGVLNTLLFAKTRLDGQALTGLPTSVVLNNKKQDSV